MTERDCIGEGSVQRQSDIAATLSGNAARFILRLVAGGIEYPYVHAIWDNLDKIEGRSRISDKGRITVKVEALRVSVSGNTATAKFHQVYTSDRLTANSRKTLVLTKHGGKWQIKQENAGN